LCGGFFIEMTFVAVWVFYHTIAGADLADVAGRQCAAFTEACVPLPEGSA